MDLATTLFEILPVQKGREEEIITLLTTVCSKLGLKTPLTPTALRAVVDVIRETNKQTHRHSLHHGCVVLLSKLAVSFPALVLDHVIAIFTFMGDSTMRMDDNYSIQVFQYYLICISYNYSIQVFQYYLICISYNYSIQVFQYYLICISYNYSIQVFQYYLICISYN